MKTLLMALACFVSWTALAQIPEAGVRAEMAGDWSRAVEIYKEALKVNPAQPDLWERIADIRATRLNTPERAVDALREATKLAPQDAHLHHKLAQAYASIQRPREGLEAIEQAVLLDPRNESYLRARAELAAWSGDYARASDSYRRLRELNAGDPDPMLGEARVLGWQGRGDESVQRYEEFLRLHPEHKTAWAEYARVQTERGDYAAAMEALESYKARFGEDAAYRKQKVRVQSWSRRPRAALAGLAPLKQAEPDDYDLNYTHTLALNANQQPRAAVRSLQDLVRLGPERKETRDITRFVETPLRSYVTGSYGHRSDSDHIVQQHAGVEGAYVLSSETRLLAGFDHEWLTARIGSGLEHINGGSGVSYNRTWIGARHALSPMWSFDGRLGKGSVQGGPGNTIHEIGASLRPADEWHLRLSHRQDLHDVSPRAISLGIERRGTRLDAEWQPDLRYTVVAMAADDRFSDGNRRWEAVVAPRRAVLRRQNFNLDIGVSAQHYGYDRDPGHGYYSPRHYERYALTAFGYWKLSDDDGISLVASYGPYKDDRMSGFRNGGDVVVEGFFGVYRDWMLNIRLGLTDFGGGFSQGYSSRGIELQLTRRF